MCRESTSTGSTGRQQTGRTDGGGIGEGRLRRISGAAIAALSLLSAAVVNAQELPTYPSATHATSSVEQDASISTGRLVLGSSAGWLLGAVAGVVVGYIAQPDAGESWIGATEWWIGGWVGSSVGAALGAHLAHARRGNLLYGTIGSLAVAPVLLLVTAPVAGAGAVLAPIAQVGVSVAIERRTTRSGR